MPGRILCYVMIIQWVVVHQSEQNDHRRDQRTCAIKTQPCPSFCYFVSSPVMDPLPFTLKWSVLFLVLLVNDSEYSKSTGTKS